MPGATEGDGAATVRSSRRGRRLLLLGLSTLFALGLAEGALRVYFWSKGIGRTDVRELLERSKRTDLPDTHGGTGLFGRMEPSPYPDVAYQLKPNLKGLMLDVSIETNRFGMRGPEISEKKPANTFRIVGLGDSHMFGWAVEQGEEYMALLERMLVEHAEPGWTFEVLNFGTPGYNTVMEVATLEHRALEFEPDLVLLHFVGNDLLAPHFLKLPPGLAPSSWYLVELVRGLAGSDQPETNELGGGDEGWEAGGTDDPAKGEPGEQQWEYAHLGGKKAFQGALDRLSRLSRERGLPVLLFQLGVKKAIYQFASDERLAPGSRFLDAQASFRALAAERGIQPGAEYRKAFVRNGHPSALGHQAYARALFCELQRMNLENLRPAPEECAWERSEAR